MAIYPTVPTHDVPRRSLLRIPEVADRLGVSRSMVYVLLHQDTPLRVCHIGRSVRIEANSVNQYIEQLAQHSER
jgi:excisionase family DNA binding protein